MMNDDDVLTLIIIVNYYQTRVIYLKQYVTFQIDIVQTGRHSRSPMWHSYKQAVFIHLKTHRHVVLRDKGLGVQGFLPCLGAGELVVQLLPLVEDVELVHTAGDIDQLQDYEGLQAPHFGPEIVKRHSYILVGFCIFVNKADSFVSPKIIIARSPEGLTWPKDCSNCSRL